MKLELLRKFLFGSALPQKVLDAPQQLQHRPVSRRNGRSLATKRRNRIDSGRTARRDNGRGYGNDRQQARDLGVSDRIERAEPVQQTPKNHPGSHCPRNAERQAGRKGT